MLASLAFESQETMVFSNLLVLRDHKKWHFDWQFSQRCHLTKNVQIGHFVALNFPVMLNFFSPRLQTNINSLIHPLSWKTPMVSSEKKIEYKMNSLKNSSQKWNIVIRKGCVTLYEMFRNNVLFTWWWSIFNVNPAFALGSSFLTTSELSLTKDESPPANIPS